MSLPEAPPAVLPQDQAQTSQAQSIVNEQQYQKEVIQYGKDKEVYDKEKAAYDLQVKNIKDAESAETKRIDDIRIAAEKEVEKRAAAFKDIEDRYTAMKNPHTYRAGHKGASYNNDGWVNWQRNYQKSKKAEIDALKYEHVVADGFKPASINRGGHIPAPPRNSYAAKFYTGEAINQSASQALQSGISSINIGNRWTRYQVEISRANAAVYAGGSLSVHAGAVQAAKNAFDGLEKQEQLKFSAAAQKESVNQQINDSKHWNEVINNPNTSKDLQKTNQVILVITFIRISIQEVRSTRSI